jgi:CheY-like chemotaxis protein
MSPDPILYVDRDLVSRLLNCAILRDSGYVVLEAQSFADACRVLERHAQLGAVVTEVDLGRGPNGFDLARVLRRRDPALTVIYLCDIDVFRYAEEGVEDSRFVPRPFDGYQIVHALDVARPTEETGLDRVPPATG